MIRVKLTNGGHTLIDDEDHNIVKKFKWYKTPQGYAYNTRKNQRILLHRLIMNPPEHLQVDHINGNKLDNRKSNLRIATHGQNLYNQKRTQKKKSSIYKGVSFYPITGKWLVQIRYNKKKYHLGYFDSEEDAAKAYDKKAKELHGEFANLNEALKLEKGDIIFT